MPLLPINVPGGVITDTTDYTNSPKWIMSDRVRFLNGKPKVWDGWQKISQYTLSGVPRAALPWKMITADRTCVAYASSSRLELVYDGIKYDITPLRKTTNPLGSNPIATVNNSPTVTVTDNAHGALAGDYVIISGATAINGVTLNGEWAIASVTDADHYTITYTSNASGTSSGGGSSVVAKYLISSGTSTAVPGLGWGVGVWSGSAGWGSPASSGASVVLEEAIWSLDLWGEDLVATRNDGTIYLWDASVGPTTRAAAISGAPSRCRFAYISSPDRHMVAFGCTSSGGTYDPMLVRWSDVEDYSTWTATATNTAGSQRLQGGTKIVCAVRTRNTFLVFSDLAAYQMYFQGTPFTFGFKPLGMRCSPVGQYAAVDVNGIVYWMADNRFYVYNGTPQVLPCPVQRYVFDRIDLTTKSNVVAGYSSAWNEVIWFYSSTGSSYPDSAVTVNVQTGEWALHSVGRTLWVDRGGILDVPLAADENGYAYDHETGNTANGGPLNPYIETGVFELSTPEMPAGSLQFLISKLVVDTELSGEMAATMYLQKYPLGAVTTKGPYTITEDTEKVSLRARGRQLKLKFSSSGIGDDWLLGTMRIEAQADSPR